MSNAPRQNQQQQTDQHVNQVIVQGRMVECREVGYGQSGKTLAKICIEIPIYDDYQHETYVHNLPFSLFGQNKNKALNVGLGAWVRINGHAEAKTARGNTYLQIVADQFLALGAPPQQQARQSTYAGQSPPPQQQQRQQQQPVQRASDSLDFGTSQPAPGGADEIPF